MSKASVAIGGVVVVGLVGFILKRRNTPPSMVAG